MPLTKTRPSRGVFTHKRYWYHVSTTLRKRNHHLIPWGTRKGFNRGEDEPEGKRICVAPSVEQCITAIPYYMTTKCNIYRTKNRVRPIKAAKVFDSAVTQEGWLQEPTDFVKIGTIDFVKIEKALNVDGVINEAASQGEHKYSRKVLRWWKKANIKRFIKSA